MCNVNCSCGGCNIQNTSSLFNTVRHGNSFNCQKCLGSTHVGKRLRFRGSLGLVGSRGGGGGANPSGRN